MGDDSLWLLPNEKRIQCLVHGIIKTIKTADGFYPVVNQFIKCSDGFFYAISDEGLFRFRKDHFEKIRLDQGKNEAVNLVQAVELNGKLFITTDPNTSAFPGSGILIVYDLKTQEYLFGKTIPKVFFVALTPLHDILLSTAEGIRKIDQQALLKGKIELSKDLAAYKIPFDIGPSNIFFDNQKNLWLLNGNGALKIEKDGTVKRFNVSNGLSENELGFLLQDKENIIWLTSAHSGVNKLVNQQLEINPVLGKNFSATSISANEASDSVWMFDAVNNDLLVFDNNFTSQFHSSSKENFRRIFTFGKKVYLTKNYEIDEVKFAGKSFSTIPVIKDDLGPNGISDVSIDESGNIIMTSDRITVVFTDKKFISIPLGYLSDQACLQNHLLWVVTRNRKLFLYRIHPEDAPHYLEPLHVFEKEFLTFGPRSVVVDKKNKVWIGTRDHGLYCYQYENGSLRFIKQLTTKNGLSENFISHLHCDKDNDVWACSPAGLDKISERNGQFLVENITKSTNFFQQVNQAVTTRTGVCWAVSSNGTLRIDPSKEDKVFYEPGILFRQIQAGDQRIIDFQKKLSLKYSNNNISFHVAAPSFLDEKLVRFSYLLQGSGSNNWSEPSSQSEINFAGLSPGKYEIKLKAEFLNGIYPEQQASYSFTIESPWWQTWWFRILAGVLVIGIIILVIRFYYKRKLEKQKFVLEKQQAIEKERTRIATDMHDDLGAGLSRIKFLSETIGIKKQQQQPIEDEISKIREYSHTMIDKMGEIVWALNERNDSLNDLLSYTRSYAVEYLSENGIQYKVDVPEISSNQFVSGELRQNIFLSVKEILHNVAKHAQANRVMINVSIKDHLQIEIKDDGIGFDQQEIKPFRNGIINVTKRMEEIGGKVEIENKNGTTVRLTVPLIP
jgi:signal transduction histidine kinase